MRLLALVLVLVVPVSAWAQEVRLDRQEFIALLGNVEAMQKKLRLNEEEITVLIQARKSRDELVRLQKGHIAELTAIVEACRARNASETELLEAVEAKLDELESSIRTREIVIAVQAAIIAGLAYKAWRGR